ncbi:MAG: hypothetical protein NXH97_21005 [Rhodobacteraceae bacterium]|nr:hypothetical protein [Paracoccaceae bacterium]
MGEISVSISDQVADDAIGAIGFPLEFNILGDSASSTGLSLDVPVLGDAELLSVERDMNPNADIPLLSELGELFEDAITDALERDDRGTLDLERLTPEEQNLMNLLRGSLSGGLINFSKKTEDETEIDQAITDVVTKGLIDFAVLWAQLRIVSRPDLDLGNPIRLSGLSTRSRAKAEACIKVFGRRLCARVTSPWIRVDGEELTLHFLTSGSKVSIKPRFKNLDFVITIRVFGKTFTIRIGFTTLVNRYFDRLPPAEVADLSVFEQPIPFSDKITRIKSVSVRDDPKGVRLIAQTEVA